jgi:hypothetical protein
MRHVVQKDIDLDNLRDVGAGLGQDRLDVLAAGGRLHGDAARHERAAWLAGDLARDEDESRGGDGLGVWAGGWGRSLGSIAVLGGDGPTWECFGGGDFLHFGCHCEFGRAVKGSDLLGFGGLKTSE